MNELVHSPQDTYSNVFGQSFRLLNAIIILSDFQLHFAGGAPVSVFDSLLLTREDGVSLHITNDIIVLDRDIATLSIGSFLSSGQLDSVSFTIGLPEAISTWSPDYFPENHPLRSTLHKLWDETSGYMFVQAVHLPVPGMDTIRWMLLDADRVTIPTDKFLSIGSSLTLDLSINYAQWFYDQQVGNLIVQPDSDWPAQVRMSFK